MQNQIRIIKKKGKQQISSTFLAEIITIQKATLMENKKGKTMSEGSKGGKPSEESD